MDSLIQFFIKNGEITTNGFVLFLAIVGYIVHKYDLREIKQTITTLSETTSEKIAALSETTSEKIAALSETTSEKIAALSETTSEKIAALSETTSEKIAALSETTSEKIATLSENVKSNTEKITEIREVLLSKGIVKPYFASKSPKQITETGMELLEKHNVSFLIDSCDLINKNHSGKIELDIFLECLDWVKNNAKRRVDEITYEDNIDEGDCTYLLALAIRDRILKGEKETKEAKEAKQITS